MSKAKGDCLNIIINFPLDSRDLMSYIKSAEREHSQKLKQKGKHMAKAKTQEAADPTTEATQETVTEQTETTETQRPKREASAEVQAARQARKEAKQAEKATRLAARTKKFGEYSEDYIEERKDKMFGVLMECKNKSAAELTATEKAALALMYVCKRGEEIGWKDFIQEYNDSLKDDLFNSMYASTFSDPHYEMQARGLETAGFNLRKQLHLAQGGRRGEKYEKHPLRLTSGEAVENQKIHPQDAQNGNDEPRKRLKHFTLPDATFDMLDDNSELVDDLKVKYFKAAA